MHTILNGYLNIFHIYIYLQLTPTPSILPSYGSTGLRSCQPKGNGGHECERIARSHSNALCVVAAVGDNVYTTEAQHLVTQQV